MILKPLTLLKCTLSKLLKLWIQIGNKRKSQPLLMLQHLNQRLMMMERWLKKCILQKIMDKVKMTKSMHKTCLNNSKKREKKVKIRMKKTNFKKRRNNGKTFKVLKKCLKNKMNKTTFRKSTNYST